MLMREAELETGNPLNLLPVSVSTTWFQLLDFGSGPRRVCPKVDSPIPAEFVAVFELAYATPGPALTGSSYHRRPGYSHNSRSASKKLISLRVAENGPISIFYSRRGMTSLRSQSSGANLAT